VLRSQGFFRIQQTCGGCGGRGFVIPEICLKCRGSGEVQVTRELEVDVPPGVDNGRRQFCC
jgi:molecular chaperone DnaJ